VCGAATATAVTMVKVALPEMRKYKYADQLSLGTIACGGMLGFMIPPSIPFVLYAYLTEESIGSLFIAGIFPGLLIAFLFIAAIYITCRRNPSLASIGPSASWKERITSIYRIWGIVLLFILVLGGIYGGIFTPTEAGAVGAFGALILGLAKRRITWGNFFEAIADTAKLAGMILVLIIGSSVFNHFIAITEIPYKLANFVGGLPMPSLVVMCVLLLVYVIVGFFMDIIAVIIITVPIIYPVLQTLNIDPVWFGVLAVLTIMIGSVTPPVGIVVYAVGGIVRDVPLFNIFRGVWPFLFAMLIAMVILIAFPQIALWLPSIMTPGS
jgi:tripartite ATP-independent transporter DctM subunit